MAWGEFSWWVIFIAAVLQMVGGMLWYGPLFGKPWMAAIGIDASDKEKIQAMQKTAGPGYAASLIFALIFGYVVDVLLASLAIANVASALVAVIGLWFAFTLANTIKAVVWGEMNKAVLLINSGFEIVFFSLVTIGAYFI